MTYQRLSKIPKGTAILLESVISCSIYYDVTCGHKQKALQIRPAIDFVIIITMSRKMTKTRRIQPERPLTEFRRKFGERPNARVVRDSP